MSQEVPVYWVIAAKGNILLEKDGESVKIPLQAHPPIDPAGAAVFNDVTEIDGIKFCAFAAKELFDETEKYKFVGLRAAWGMIPDNHHNAAGKCCELIHWDNTSKFCSTCGSALVQVGPVTKKCEKCGFRSHPNISTAVLILIKKGDQICMVHSRGFRGTYYSLVAGYLEIGETLEECVRREVREELQIEVTNIRYWGSQPWPYPSQNMVGFVCDYESGEIKLQESELGDGGFYGRDNLPEMPGRMSMAYRMIQEWIAGNI